MWGVVLLHRVGVGSVHDIDDDDDDDNNNRLT